MKYGDGDIAEVLFDRKLLPVLVVLGWASQSRKYGAREAVEIGAAEGSEKLNRG